MSNYTAAAVEGETTTIFSFSYDGMNRISGYVKEIDGIGAPPQTEEWSFYYGPTGIDKITRSMQGIQNLTIDYSTDTNGRILIASYSETGGFNGNLAFVYDNYGNVAAQEDDDGDITKAVLINPNNGAINKRYDPHSIDDDPYTYRVRDGFMSIGDLWAGGGGTVYIQGHPVIPNPWGDAVTNGTTTTTTDDTTDKDGGDDEGDCNSSSCNSGTTS